MQVHIPATEPDWDHVTSAKPQDPRSTSLRRVINCQRQLTINAIAAPHRNYPQRQYSRLTQFIELISKLCDMQKTALSTVYALDYGGASSAGDGDSSWFAASAAAGANSPANQRRKRPSRMHAGCDELAAGLLVG